MIVYGSFDRLAETALYYVQVNTLGLKTNLNVPSYGYEYVGTWTEVTTTPLPAALSLFAGGLGLLGMIGARKRRTPIAA